MRATPHDARPNLTLRHRGRDSSHDGASWTWFHIVVERLLLLWQPRWRIVAVGAEVSGGTVTFTVYERTLIYVLSYIN